MEDSFPRYFSQILHFTILVHFAVLVCDIAVFVLKRDIKFQPTKQPTNQPSNQPTNHFAVQLHIKPFLKFSQ